MCITFARTIMFAGMVLVVSACTTAAPTGKSTPTASSTRLEDPAPDQETFADRTISAIATADRQCTQLPKVIGHGEKSIILCAWSPTHATWHEVELRVPYPIPRSYLRCKTDECHFPIHVLNDGYRTEHLAGYGPTRFSVNLYAPDGERLVVYRTRHAQVNGTVASYTPFHEDFRDEGLRERGHAFLVARIDAAREELLAQGVMSRAFPGELIANVIPDEAIYALALIEQADDRKFFTDQDNTVGAIETEYALNGDEAFQHSRSTAYALGALQFTNAHGNGTYDLVVRKYPEAGLIDDFETGATTLKNAIKAAWLLLDLELAQYPEVHDRFRSDPIRVVGTYLAPAYNGGPLWARRLLDHVTRSGTYHAEDFAVQLPTVLYGKRHRHRRPSINAETPNYARKFFGVIPGITAPIPVQQPPTKSLEVSCSTLC